MSKGKTQTYPGPPLELKQWWLIKVALEHVARHFHHAKARQCEENVAWTTVHALEKHFGGKLDGPINSAGSADDGRAP